VFDDSVNVHTHANKVEVLVEFDTGSAVRVQLVAKHSRHLESELSRLTGWLSAGDAA
jgi:hypothetical protein